MKTCDLLGDLELVTAPTSYPITLEEARSHLRVNTRDEDERIEDELIPEATAFCESKILGERQFMLATYDLPLRAFWSGPLALPRPPLSSITSLKYYDQTGTLQTVSSALYLVRTPWKQPGTIERAPDANWTFTTQSDCRFPVVIRFIAGYASAAVVPFQAKAAIKLALGWLHLNREPMKAELDSVESLLEQLGHGFYG